MVLGSARKLLVPVLYMPKRQQLPEYWYIFKIGSIKQQSLHCIIDELIMPWCACAAKAYSSLLVFLSVILSVTGIAAQHVQLKC